MTGPHAWRWRLVLVFLVAIVGTGFRHPEWWKSESARALALVGALPLGVIALVTLRRLRHAEAIRPAPTGPAMLPELARSLPRSVVDRIDVWLVWTPSKSNIARQLRDPLRDGPPTLLIDLDTPGCGSLIVAGTGVAAEQAADVATSLHIPYRRRWRGGASLGGFARQGIPCVTLAGRPDQPPDPALLRAVAHLIAELALRRARSATAA